MTYKFTLNQLCVFSSSHFLHFLFGQDPSALHPFTDINGRTLQAKLIEAGAESVKVEWNGQTFDFGYAGFDNPKSDSSVESSVAIPKSSGKVYDWTDTQGRNIQAKFVKADQNSLTVLNGKGNHSATFDVQ